MSHAFYAYSSSDIEALKAYLDRQAIAIREIVASGQECPDALRDFERKRAKLAHLIGCESAIAL